MQDLEGGFQKYSRPHTCTKTKASKWKRLYLWYNRKRSSHERSYLGDRKQHEWREWSVFASGRFDFTLNTYEFITTAFHSGKQTNLFFCTHLYRTCLWNWSRAALRRTGTSLCGRKSSLGIRTLRCCRICQSFSCCHEPQNLLDMGSLSPRDIAIQCIFNERVPDYHL